MLMYHICSWTAVHGAWNTLFSDFLIWNPDVVIEGIQAEKMRIFQEIWVYKEPTGVRNDHSKAKVFE